MRTIDEDEAWGWPSSPYAAEPFSTPLDPLAEIVDLGEGGWRTPHGEASEAHRRVRRLVREEE